MKLISEDESTAHGKIMYCLQELSTVEDLVNAFNDYMKGYFDV